MGYTHYYTVDKWSAPEWQAAWPLLIDDAVTIIDAANVPLSGPARETREEGEENHNPPIVDVNEGLCINGANDNSYEDFVLNESEPDNFCKTGRRAYDLVVSCILLRAYRLAPNTFHLRSDGLWDVDEEWVPTRALYHDIWPEDADEKPAELEKKAPKEENNGVGRQS